MQPNFSKEQMKRARRFKQQRRRGRPHREQRVSVCSPVKQLKTNEKGTSIRSQREHSVSPPAQRGAQRWCGALKGTHWERGASLHNELPAAQLLRIMAAFIRTQRECVCACVWMFVVLSSSVGKGLPGLLPLSQ